MIGLWLLAGAILGVLHVATQRWTIRRLEGSSVASILLLSGGGMVLRLALTAGLLLAALQQGILPALAAFGGLMIARWLLLILANRDSLYLSEVEPEAS